MRILKNTKRFLLGIAFWIGIFILAIVIDIKLGSHTGLVIAVGQPGVLVSRAIVSVCSCTEKQGFLMLILGHFGTNLLVWGFLGVGAGWVIDRLRAIKK